MEQILVEVQNVKTEILAALAEHKKAIDEKQHYLGAHIDQLEARLGAPDDRRPPERKTIELVGDLVVKEAAFLQAVKTHGRGRLVVGAMHPQVSAEELGLLERKTVLSSDVGYGTSGVLMPERISGVTPLARRKLRMRDILRARPAGASMVDFVKETVFTSGASPQVEGSPKGESDIQFQAASERIRTIAHFIVGSRQLLDDAPELARAINSSLLYQLKKVEEAQFLAGSGTGEDLNGLLGQAGTYQNTYGDAGDTPIDIVRHAVLEMNLLEEEPDSVVLSPVDWHAIQLVKDEVGGANTGKYIASDPLGGVLVVPTLWGLNVVVSNSQTPGTFLMGNFQLAEIRDRLDAVVDISTEDSDNFRKNLITLRAEERCAIVCFRTTAFMRGSF